MHYITLHYITLHYIPPHSGLSRLLQDPSGARQGWFSSQSPPGDILACHSNSAHSPLPTLRTFIRDEGPSYTEGIQTEGCLVPGETKLCLEVLRTSNAHHRVIRHQSGSCLGLEESEVVKS